MCWVTYMLNNVKPWSILLYESDNTQRRIIRLYCTSFVEVAVNMWWHARFAKDYDIILKSSSGSYNCDLLLFRCKHHLQSLIVITETLVQIDHHHLIHAVCFILWAKNLGHNLWIGLPRKVTIWVMDNTLYKWCVCKLGVRHSACE